MCAHAASPTPNLILDGIHARLRGQYRLHRRGALFWTAYQSMQLELVRDHPRDHVRLCNAMADIAEDLGVVEHAQLIGNHNAVSTLR